jgi:hypothetical protein
MTVAVDAVGTELAFNSSTSVNFTGITVGASATALACVLAFNNSTLTPVLVAATWNGVPMTIEATGTAETTGTAFAYTVILGLPNPAAGNKTLAVTWTNAALGYVGAISFTGTDTTTPFTNGAGSGSTTGASQSVTITSATGDIVIAVASDISEGYTAVNASGGGGIFNASGTGWDNTGAGGNAASFYSAGAATVTMTATTGTNSDTWSIAGCNVVPPSGGGVALTGSQPLLFT